ncbi:hypothetical protein M3E78_005735 [Micrococcus luteus]|nr:hypothetical protein [Micrococcus luteus]MCV7574093.1 hypothetical protein [Micrococcus luteus]
MSTVQLDLFDLLDPGTPAAPPVRRSGPGECPACGEPVPDVAGWWASANHGFDYLGNPLDVDECISMILTRNHILVDLATIAHIDRTGTTCDQADDTVCFAHGTGKQHRAVLTATEAQEVRTYRHTRARDSYQRAAHVWRNHLSRLHAYIGPDLESAGLTITDLKETP